jgi:hypothetical protein
MNSVVVMVDVSHNDGLKLKYLKHYLDFLFLILGYVIMIMIVVQVIHQMKMLIAVNDFDV